MLKNELTEHLGYEEHKRSDSKNSKNGTKSKKLRSSYREVEIDVLQDRNASFELKKEMDDAARNWGVVLGEFRIMYEERFIL